jgi:hypothetical protein
MQRDALVVGAASAFLSDATTGVVASALQSFADRIGAVLADAGATVTVKPRPTPSWARDVARR